MTSSDFSQLKIWQRSMSLAKKIYEITRRLPKEELYGLTSQMRRAVISIPSNIAEGSQRHSRKDFANFVSIAKGSLAELETQCILAKDLGFIEENNLTELRKEIIEISKMLHSFHSQLVPHTS